jgi:GntR family transcriptional regulator, trigonelline degradation regulator
MHDSQRRSVAERISTDGAARDAFPEGVVSLDSYPTYIPLREAVFRSLKTAIVEGLLEPGQAIVENKIAGELAVSRTPVREAIRMLEAEGLVTFLPGRKAIVSAPSVREIEEIYEIRLLVETEALRRITPERTKLIEELEGYTQIADGYFKQGDIAEMGRVNIRFHLGIISAFNNEKLQQIVKPLHDVIGRFLRYTLMDRDWALRGNEEHKQIIAYAKQGKPEEAVSLMTKHLTDAKQVSVEMVLQMAESRKAERKPGRSTAN